MNKSLVKFTIFGLFIFVSVLSYRLYFNEPKGLKLAENARLRDYVTSPLPKKEASRVQAYINQQLKGAPAAEPAQCIEQRRRVLSSSTEDLLKEVESGRLVMAEECRNYDAALADQSYIDMIYKSCGRKAEDDENLHSACATGLFFFKSILVSEANRDRDIRELDAQSLIHLLFADLGTSNFKTPGALADMKAVTERLIELMPNSPSAYKAAVVPLMIQSVDAIKAGQQASEALYSALERAMQMNPGDQQLENINNLLQTHEGSEISLDKAAALAQSQPDSITTQIFYAKALARQKQYDQSREYIEQLAARFPNDQNIIEAQRRLAQNPAEFGTFEMSLGSDF